MPFFDAPLLIMAAAGPSRDCVRFTHNSDSESEFEGFDASEIEQIERRQSDYDFHFGIDDDGSVPAVPAMPMTLATALTSAATPMTPAATLMSMTLAATMAYLKSKVGLKPRAGHSRA